MWDFQEKVVILKKKLAEDIQSGIGKTCKICRATLQSLQFRKW